MQEAKAAHRRYDEKSNIVVLKSEKSAAVRSVTGRKIMQVHTSGPSAILCDHMTPPSNGPENRARDIVD